MNNKQVDDYVMQAPLSVSRPTRKTKRQSKSQTERLKHFQANQSREFRETIISRLCVGIYWDNFYSQLETE